MDDVVPCALYATSDHVQFSVVHEYQIAQKDFYRSDQYFKYYQVPEQILLDQTFYLVCSTGQVDSQVVHYRSQASNVLQIVNRKPVMDVWLFVCLFVCLFIFLSFGLLVCFMSS